MDKYILSACITFIFIVFKILDSKFIKKHELDTKSLIRDSVIIYLASIVADLINENMLGETGSKPSVAVYTGDAGF